MPRFDPHDRESAEFAANAERENESDSPQSADAPRHSRRTFLAGAALLVLTGCSSTTQTARLPEPTWRRRHDLPSDPGPTIDPAPLPSTPGGVIARSSWAQGQPAPSLLNAMLPVRYITVHHDGSSAFYAADASSSMARLESIRRSHRGQNWGDIGYHFAVDRAGRVYECRPLAWQGAHVKNHNEGNIGVVNLGNFDLQTPSEAQVQGLQSILRTLQSQYGVAASRVRTHQEWAPTACPGRSMQSCMNALRSSGRLA